jgi:rod shape determining protein RodA
MFDRVRRFLTKGDWVLTAALILLFAIGLAALYASGKSSSGAYENFVEQAGFIGIGIVLYVAVGSFDYRRLRSFAPVLFIVSALLLVSVLVFGSTINNTTGWFRIGPFGIQPIEFVKVLWILSMSAFLVSRGSFMSHWKNILQLFGLMILLVGLTLLQPDLGSAMIVLATTLGVLLITNVRRTHILILIGILVAICLVSWFGLLQGYQKERILVLFNPARDPLGGGYHVTQSIIAIGSGGWLGRGLGYGSQSQLKFLPEQQTDFIFAVIGEELGFIGAGLVLVLFGVILFRCARIASLTSNDFGTFVSYGVMLMIFFHVVVNVGMNLGLLPVAGIPLPFVSYGGSSLLAMMIAAGLVQSVIVHQSRLTAT